MTNSKVIWLPPASCKKCTNKKIKVIPNIFATLLKIYQKKQDDLLCKKIEFLTEQAYEYYYALFETPKIAKLDLDLPEFIYEEQRKKLAFEYAAKAVIRVIADNRVDKCYKERKKELKLLLTQNGACKK